MLAVNTAKFQLLFLGLPSSDLPITIYVNEVSVTSTETVDLLGISIDSKLTFSNYILSLCQRAGYQVRSLSRIRHFLPKNILFQLFNAYILSIFNYVPLIWMFHGKTISHKIDSMHNEL